MESLWHRSKEHSKTNQHWEGKNDKRDRSYNDYRGYFNNDIGAGIWYALPMPITVLLGAVFLITGIVVIVKGFFKEFRNP